MTRLSIALAAAALLLAACGDKSSPTSGNGVAPTVTSTGPLDVVGGVVRNPTITATFSEAMRPSTLNIVSYELRSGGTLVPATVTYDGATAHLLPSASLAANTTYTVSISTEAKDVEGVPLNETKTWTFTTIATAVTGPAKLNLGTAAFYSILAQSAVANSGTSEVIGDMALTPGASSAITGFALSAPTSYATSAYVFGKVYAADYATPTAGMLANAG